MNINVLEGIRCPKCGNEESFCISVKTMAIVCDDGVSELYGDNAWDDDSYIECHCGHSGTVGNFRHDRTHWGECFTCSWGDQTTDNPVKCLSCNHGDMWQGLWLSTSTKQMMLFCQRMLRHFSFRTPRSTDGCPS